MPVLTIDYRHCDRMRPKYLRHPEVEEIALRPAASWWRRELTPSRWPC